MRILADENIPLVEAFFGSHGDIRRLPGRGIDRAALGDAEVLLVRSVTDVSRELLQGSQVKFVGTCTIGTDHLDLAYFAEAGIAWSSAPGCNARGVVDWVLGSLLALAEVHGANLAERRYGVVGAGQVGGRLVDVLRGLGWDVRVCDPPRQRAEGGDFCELDEILRECDVISLHTPLTRDGTHPTRHLLDAGRLAALRPGTWLLNASRGGVVDNTALREHLASGAELDVALDVWEGEPQVDVDLAARCRIATPHIAGYSLDGKLRGTAQIYDAFCAWRGCRPEVVLDDLLPAQWLAELSLTEECDPQWALAMLCRAVYDPRSDDAAFRRSLVGDEQARRKAFDVLRKHYPPRREITGLWVDIQGDALALERLLGALGANRVGE
ncbi:4-phosphoerythronate dehydrogenase PdxB [Pseudomonas sp. ZM23]|uniref:Erythronate-4-phosphate dehydrogenase n=1 Tax=Pseudomonas triclosanedens TaxID=2961893 RepID=A0ABY7A4W2_9PSED|nr:4-phosphoerythronate dehydrogenase PdxB [Pseudomonas triclosanedens]MCP8465550.1 4-phosphoerythronate dehydrogenase PdxB [Pseudomonas triclosanedens]MCP8471045.1 4-phosphoerythronate dehydrogenase PdxB [Pseudomonas triclosanedens]MCP8476849.1 4-phosphoerythronate dehydrogenase PdxB [Pseudomonas triclosanedens]WAI52036.1 4-phosphoerythronate dehydrogenase PdxB [Pseudomonas triclosanedens]